jgi:hypothetical protein
MAARNLYARSFAKEPNTKVLAHVGYSHAIDSRTAVRAKALAWQLSQLTGVDPLTVDQTQMTERTDTAMEDPEYRRALQNNWLTKNPIVVRKPDGAFYRSSTDGFGGVDMQVFSPRTQDNHGRPAWLARLGRTFITPKLPIPKDGKPYLVQAFAAGMSDDAVPVDQYMSWQYGHAALALPSGRFRVVVVGENGKLGESEVIVR